MNDFTIIDDPSFTLEAFMSDPFKWVDPAHYKRVSCPPLFPDMLVEQEPIEGYPTLFNAVTMDGKSYILLEILGSGHMQIIGSESGRHLLLDNKGRLELSELQPHHAVLASVMTLGARDITTFSPLIQVRAVMKSIKETTTEWRSQFLHDFLDRLANDFMDTPDLGRKRWIYYHMLYIANFLKPNKQLFDEYFKNTSPRFVHDAMCNMHEYFDSHDAVREASWALKIVARNIYPARYSDGNVTLHVWNHFTLTHNGPGGKISFPNTAPKSTCKRKTTMVGFRPRRRVKKEVKPSWRVGAIVIRKVRNERKNVLTGKYVQSLITEWSHGMYPTPQHASCNNNKKAGFEVPKEVKIPMRNSKQANSFIDYLLAASGDIGEYVAQQSDELTTRKQRRAFVKAIYKRARMKLTAKQFKEWVAKFVRSMIKDDFLTDEAMTAVGNWDERHASKKIIPITTYKALLDRLANIYVPA